MSLSPTQRTLRELRNKGRLCDIVERFLSNARAGGIRRDLFHIFDIVALCPGRGIVGVQSCGRDFAAHYRKMTEDYGENTIEWLRCGGHAELWGWRKVKYKRNGKLLVWRPRIADITFKDFKGIYENIID